MAHHARPLLSFKSMMMTNVHLHKQKNLINLRQPVRYGAKEKQERTRAQIYAEQRRKQEAKSRIPVLVIPHVMKISDILKTTGRTAEQVFQAKASCEQVAFVKQQSYPLNETLSHPLLSCVMKTMGFRIDYQTPSSSIISQDKDIYAKPVSENPQRLQLRPPVVAVMGHVDHGKTTVLDALRNTSVAKNEAGGITQSIGAFSVSLHSDYAVTFLDTPGHSVFTSMRERGAQVADIVLLMVAADDGVMEQTIESINMIKMADTPVVVAINKCDRPDAAPDLVIEDLDNHGIKCEDIGGDVPVVKISALMKKGLDNLVQTLVATAELHSIKCDPNMQVQGFVLESQTQKGRGNLCSVLIKQGTLKVGQILVAGNSMAKVKAITDTRGRKLKTLFPGEAGLVMGWKTLPSAGQLLLQAESETQAKDALRYRAKEMEILASDEILEEVMKKRELEKREYENLRAEYTSKKQRKAASFRVAFEKNKHCESVPILNVIIKADVDGSMEAIMKIVNSYDCEDECILNVVSHGVGPLKISEYELAKELQASIFLFNTDIPISCTDGVEVVKHDVIYQFVKSLKDKLTEKLPTVEKDTTKGEARVLEVFTKRKLVIAGCKVYTGVLDSKDIFVLERDGIVLHKGSLSSMRQHATILSKATAGNECGIVFEEDLESGIQIGDTLRCVTVTEEKQEISWMPPGF